MVEDNLLSSQRKEDLERMFLISRYKKEVERAIWDVETTSFLIAIPCALSSYNCTCYFLDDKWLLLCVLSLALSGCACYDIAKGILIQRVRRRWSYPQKSSPYEWERTAAKQFDDALASCIWPIHIIVKTMVVVSVLAGTFIYVDQDHPERIYLVIAAFALLGWYYRNDD